MRKLLVVLAIMGLALVMNSSARADTDVITLGSPASGLSCCTGPYGTATITTTSANTATVTFTSLMNGGYLYLLGGQDAADLNVNAKSFSLSNITESNSIDGFNPTYRGWESDEVSSFGDFNLTLKNFDGFKDSATTISFTLTDKSGTWANAGDVLANNGDGYDAALHAFACTEPGCSPSSGAFTTSYAADSSSSPAPAVPEPASLALLGSGSLALAMFVRRLKS